MVSVFINVLLKCPCLCAYVVLATVKFFEMPWLEAKLIFCSRSPVHPSLLKSSVCHQPDRERRRDRQREREGERQRVSRGFNLGISECCSDTVLHQDKLPDMLWLVATALDQPWGGGGRKRALWNWGRSGGRGMEVKERSWWTWLVASALGELKRWPRGEEEMAGESSGGGVKVGVQRFSSKGPDMLTWRQWYDMWPSVETLYGTQRRKWYRKVTAI